MDFQWTATPASGVGGGSREAGFTEKENEVGTDMSATTAGTDQRRGYDAGNDLRGAAAIRPFPRDFNGRGASVFGVLALLAALFAMFASAAGAATVTDRPLLFKFQTGQKTAGDIAVDYQTGAVYTLSNETGATGILKFHPDGTPWNFSATGTNRLPTEPSTSDQSAIAVDNSGGATQGRIYVPESDQGNFVSVHDSGGNLLGSYRPVKNATTIDLAVDAQGHLWVFTRGDKTATELSSAIPGTKLSEVTFPSEVLAGGVDFSGAVYAWKASGELDLYKAVGGSPSFFMAHTSNIDADLSGPTGHLFAANFTNTTNPNSISELDASGSEIETFGEEFFGDLPPSGQFFFEIDRSLAYYPAGDSLYVFTGPRSVADDVGPPTVSVFGPRQTGEVGDATGTPASLVEVAAAHLNGTVNPQGTTSEWYFEWKKPKQRWISARSSSPQSLPVDSSDHTVEVDIGGLRGNTDYEFRVVTMNPSTKLRSFSSPQSFKTLTASADPVVTLDPASNLTAESAKLTGTVDPEGDTAEWRVEYTTDPTCTSGFKSEPMQQIAQESTSPVPVEWTLTGLLPSQEYCARIIARNSHTLEEPPFSNQFPTQGVASVQFATDPVPFTDFEVTGVAPRLDTSARLNALVNPQGEDITFHFEYSADGGANWSVLPDRVDDSELRSLMVISQSVEGLESGTEYLFRVAVENPVHSEVSDERSFNTRSTDEVTLPQRGYELVNKPDKGNQNVSIPLTSENQSPISTDGNRVVWTAQGGIPDGPNGNQPAFLAERSSSGWQSRPIAPPAPEQIGGGELSYYFRGSNANMTNFLLTATRPAGFGYSPQTAFARVDADRNQTVLQSYNFDIGKWPLDATSDFGHVLLVDSPQVPDEARGQVVDIGSGTREVISIMPDGTESECGVDAGSGFGGQGGVAAYGAVDTWHPGYQMIDSVDGSIVYFLTSPNGECSARKGLYVRDRNASVTTLIDPSIAGEAVRPIRASSDGQQFYFMTMSQLDPVDSNEGNDIYRWDQASGESTCLTCVVPDAEVVPTSVMISDDFSRIYFLSEHALVPGQGVEGVTNAYLLDGEDLKHLFVGNANFKGGGFYGPEMTASGDVLLFPASAGRSLTSDETAAHCLYTSHGPIPTDCRQLYRYELDEESLECVTCSRGSVTKWAGDGLGGYHLSKDGSTIAFDTRETLLPGDDINGRDDIYEWHNGAYRLITSGEIQFPEEETLVPKVRGITDDGGSILYTAPEPDRTGYERDFLANMYVARIGGGFDRPSPTLHCSEESCQGPLQPPPVDVTAGSRSVQGNGNFVSGNNGRKCRKGKVRRHGKCVRRAHKRHPKTHGTRRNHGNGKGGRGE